MLRSVQNGILKSGLSCLWINLQKRSQRLFLVFLSSHCHKRRHTSRGFVGLDVNVLFRFCCCCCIPSDKSGQIGIRVLFEEHRYVRYELNGAMNRGDRRTDRTDRQTDRQTCRQTEKHTDREDF